MTIYWPNTVPARFAAYNNCVQMTYTVVEDPTHTEPGVQVHCQNIYAPANDIRSRFNYWRTFPVLYRDYLRRILYRLDLWVYALRTAMDPTMAGYNSRTAKDYSNAVKMIQRNLIYTDKILDNIFNKAHHMRINGTMTPGATFNALDKWLAREVFTSGMHSPDAYIIWRSNTGDMPYSREAAVKDRDDSGEVGLSFTPDELREFNYYLILYAY